MNHEPDPAAGLRFTTEDTEHTEKRAGKGLKLRRSRYGESGNLTSDTRQPRGHHCNSGVYRTALIYSAAGWAMPVHALAVTVYNVAMKLPRKARLSVIFAGVAAGVFLIAPLIAELVMLITPSGPGDWGDGLLALFACAAAVGVLMLIALGFAIFSWEEEGRAGTLAFFAELVLLAAMILGALPYLLLWGM